MQTLTAWLGRHYLPRDFWCGRCPSAAFLWFSIHNLPLWISLIRGVHRFAPYAAQERRGRGSPSPLEPLQPFPADNADHVGIRLPALVSTLLDGQQAVPLGQPDCGLSQAPADARPRRDGVDRQPAGAVASDIIPNDPQDRELPGGEATGERRRHRAGAGQPTAALDRHGSLRSPLGALGREQRHATEGNAHGHHGLADRIPAGVQRLGQALGFSVGHGLGGVGLPDSA